jgi:glycosyltransferase involved in cell wall biosynthesis
MVYPFLSNFQPAIIAPDGVDLEQFRPVENNQLRERLKIPPTVFVAGYAGHFYPGKGLELIEKLATICPDFQFLVMGGMPEEVNRLTGQSKRVGNGNILYTGFIANADLPDYLSICDVLLLPNKERVAGFGGGNIGRWTSPMKMFEYMATGRMILASDLPVLREVLNESNAIFCDPHDIESWRQMLIYAERNKSLRKKIGMQARKDVEQYTWIRRVDRCLSPVFIKQTEMRKT